MIIDWLTENKKVIAFEIVLQWFGFLLYWVVCHLIPENMRSGGWFVEHQYQSQSK